MKRDDLLGWKFMKRKYHYLISVVIAVYNTKNYLDDMIRSILNQKKIGLRWSERFLYEIILVDDGSTDGSGEICDYYADRYPFVKVFHKSHGGASSARNKGIDMASGKYITFPDSDDVLSDCVFCKCIIFFEKCARDVALITYPLLFFDGQQGEHWTTYRFENGSGVVNMLMEWNSPQYFTAASFFRTDDIKGKVYFDENLSNGEDIIFANTVIMKSEKPLVGLVSDCRYYYRRRTTGSLSVIQISRYTQEYYIPYLRDVLLKLFEMAHIRYGYIPKYIEYTVMGQLQWRLGSKNEKNIARKVIGEMEYRKYHFLINEILKDISDEVAWEFGIDVS